MSKYYVTFGSEGQPFHGGWLEIEAENYNQACHLFMAIYPPKDGLMNCCSIYHEENFKKTSMYQTNDNMGSSCHGTISLNINIPEYKKTAEPVTQSGQSN